MWRQKLADQAGFALEPGAIQEPGVIPDDVLAELGSSITSLPPRKKYQKK